MWKGANMKLVLGWCTVFCPVSMHYVFYLWLLLSLAQTFCTMFKKRPFFFLHFAQYKFHLEFMYSGISLMRFSRALKIKTYYLKITLSKRGPEDHKQYILGTELAFIKKLLK